MKPSNLFLWGPFKPFFKEDIARPIGPYSPYTVGKNSEPDLFSNDFTLVFSWNQCEEKINLWQFFVSLKKKTAIFSVAILAQISM